MESARIFSNDIGSVTTKDLMRDAAGDIIDCFNASNRAGWWSMDNPLGKVNITRRFNLIHSELAEATEADRRGARDSHLPLYPGVLVEFADAYIRTCDILGAITAADVSGAFGNYLGKTIAAAINIDGEPWDPIKDGGAEISSIIFSLHNLTDSLAMSILLPGEEADDVYVTATGVLASYSVAAEALYRRYGITLREVIDEKMAYNAHRADHKPEARRAKGGKAY